MANLFCSYNKELGALPNSIAEYWLTTYVKKGSDLGQEPSSKSQDWLADVLEFLAGEERAEVYYRHRLGDAQGLDQF